MIGLKTEFSGKKLVKLGFIFKPIISLSFELVSVTQIAEVTRVIPNSLVQVSSSTMKEANVLLLNDKSAKTIIINPLNNISNNLNVNLT